MRFSKTIRIPKSELDPFGSRQQAEYLAKNRVDVGRHPNVTRLQYDTVDCGDHYEITIHGVTVP